MELVSITISRRMTWPGLAWPGLAWVSFALRRPGHNCDVALVRVASISRQAPGTEGLRTVTDWIRIFERLFTCTNRT